MAHTTTEDETRDYVIGIICEVCKSHGLELVARETFQKKIDGDGKSVEASAILAVNEVLEQLRIENFATYLSHSDVLTSILEAVRVPESLQRQTFNAIRCFSKFNIEGFVSELQDIGVSETSSTVLADLFLNTDEILNQESDINQTIVSNLLNIVDNATLSELGQILRFTGRKPVLIDPALPCDSPYCPGIVIEARTSGLENLGSGGCINIADGQSTAFVFSFDIENIIELMENSKVFPSTKTVSP